MRWWWVRKKVGMRDKEKDRLGVTARALCWGQTRDGSIFIHWHLWAAEAGAVGSREPDHCHFHLLPIMPFSRAAMRSCSGPLETKWPSVGTKAEGTEREDGRKRRREAQGLDPRDTGFQSKAGPRLTQNASGLLPEISVSIYFINDSHHTKCCC